MADGYEYGQDVYANNGGGQPSYDPSYGDEDQTAQVPQYDDTGSEDFIPTTLVGGLDQLRARTQRKSDALLKKAQELRYQQPTYIDRDGNYTHEAPYHPQGVEYRLGGEVAPMYAPGPKSIQDQHAKDLENQAMQMQQNFPRLPDGTPLRNSFFQENSDRIFNDIMVGAKGHLSRDSFFNNPYWDQFKGMDNDTQISIKQAVSQALKHRFNDQIKLQNFQGDVGEAIQDPTTAMFASPFMREFQARPGSADAINKLNTAKAKADAINADPELKADFDKLVQNSQIQLDPEAPVSPEQRAQIEHDKAVFRKAMASSTITGFNSTMMSWRDSQDRLTENRKKMYEDADGKMSVMKGSLSEEVRSSIGEMVNGGYWDGEDANLNRFIERLKKTDGPVDLPRPINGITQVPGLKLQSMEVDTVNKLKTWSDLGMDMSKALVSATGNVVPSTQFIPETEKDIIRTFGDTRIKTSTPGDYVKLDLQKLEDSNGEVVYLSEPGEHEISPITYKFNGAQYVKRDVLLDVLQKSGIDPKELKTGDPLTIDSKKFGEILAKDAQEYKAHLLTGQEFLDAPEGERFATNKNVLEKIRAIEANQKDVGKSDALFYTPPSEPRFFNEVAKGLTHSLISAGAEISLFVPAVVNSLYNTGKASGYLSEAYAKDVLGDNPEDILKNKAVSSLLNTNLAGAYLIDAYVKSLKGVDSLESTLKAKEAYDSSKGAHGELALPGLGSKIEEYGDNQGFWNLNKFVGDPNATDAQKLGYFGGHFMGDMASMYAEMAMMDAPAAGLKLQSVAGKFGALANKMAGYTDQLAALQKFAGNAPEIAALSEKMSKAAHIAHSALSFTGLSILKGNITPTDLMEVAGTGATIGTATSIGRGLRFPFLGKLDDKLIQEADSMGGVQYQTMKGSGGGMPILPDWKRVGAAGLADIGIVALDTLRKLYSGMTGDDIIEWWKKPENYANMATFLAMPFLGQTRYKGVNLEREQLYPPPTTIMSTTKPGLLNLAGRRMLPIGKPVERGSPINIEGPEIKAPIVRNGINLFNAPTPEELAAKGSNRGPSLIPQQEEPARSIPELVGMQNRFMELFNKGYESLPKDEKLEMDGMSKFLTQNDLSQGTKEAVMRRANTLAKEIQDRHDQGLPPDPALFAENHEAHKLLLDPKAHEKLFFKDVISKEGVDGPTAVKMAQDEAVNLDEGRMLDLQGVRSEQAKVKPISLNPESVEQPTPVKTPDEPIITKSGATVEPAAVEAGAEYFSKKTQEGIKKAAKTYKGKASEAVGKASQRAEVGATFSTPKLVEDGPNKGQFMVTVRPQGVQNKGGNGLKKGASSRVVYGPEATVLQIAKDQWNKTNTSRKEEFAVETGAVQGSYEQDFAVQETEQRLIANEKFKEYIIKGNSLNEITDDLKKTFKKEYGMEDPEHVINSFRQEFVEDFTGGKMESLEQMREEYVRKGCQR